MRPRNLADPSFEPSDDDLRELLAHAAQDARARHARAAEIVHERVCAERARLGLATAPPAKPE